MDNEMKYSCVKEITKELRKTFRGIQSNSYGFCCMSDYDAHHEYINDNDYVCAKIFKGGLNNDYCYEEREFDLYNHAEINFIWHLADFILDDVIEVMSKVAEKYGCKIEKPIDESKCIKLLFL